MVLKMKPSCAVCVTGAAGALGNLGDGVQGIGNATLAYDEDKQNPAHDGLGALPVHSQAGKHLPLVLQVTWGLVCLVSIVLLLLMMTRSRFRLLMGLGPSLFMFQAGEHCHKC